MPNTRPLYADPQYVATIREPRNGVERESYDRIVSYSTQAALAVPDIFAPLEAIMDRQKAEGDTAAREEAAQAIRKFGFFARRSVDVRELERWLGRVAFVTFMLRTSELAQEATAAVSGRPGHFPQPAPQAFGVSDAGAEALCAEWMRHLGVPEAATTRHSGDGGIDVESTNYIAQVKNYAGTVGVAEVREMAGVAHGDGRHALFFTSGEYASGATEFAERVGMALFQFNAIDGTLTGRNRFAVDMIANGLDGHRRR